MAKKVRVLRLIEYTYSDVETMERDMARWTSNHMSGIMTMKSVALPLEVLDEEDNGGREVREAVDSTISEGDNSSTQD